MFLRYNSAMLIQQSHTKRINFRSLLENILSCILLVIALYLIVTPFIPQIGLWISKTTDKTGGFEYVSKHPLSPQNVATQNNVLPTANPDLKPIPKDDRLVIPSIQVDIPIVEGTSSYVLMKGGWRRPQTSTPDKGGNTVIAAHRFLYTSTNGSYFYNLDKVKVGDPIVVYWKGVEYDYEVASSKQVPATAVEIESNTPDPILTLYTCTPLWTAKDRLVIVAKPV